VEHFFIILCTAIYKSLSLVEQADQVFNLANEFMDIKVVHSQRKNTLR